MLVALILTALVAGQPQTAAQQQAIADACLTPAEQTMAIDAISAQRREAVIACVTAEVAELVNAGLPQQLDAATTLVSVESKGTNLVYNNRVEVDARDVTDADRATVAEGVRGYVCTQADMTQMISFGASYTYVWIDRSGKPIHRMTVASC